MIKHYLRKNKKRNKYNQRKPRKCQNVCAKTKPKGLLTYFLLIYFTMTKIKITCSHGVIFKVRMSAYGTRKRLNIINVLSQTFQLPVLLMLFSLKYLFTLEFRVLKKFAGSFLENLRVTFFI